MNLNNVQLVGNVVRDPEIHRTPNGTPVTNISLGVNEVVQVVDDMKKKITTFVDVQVWGTSAENLAKLVHKGEELFVQGSLRQETWDDKQTGKNRSKVFVRADSWQFTQYRATEAARHAAQNRGQEVTR
jgi:single-strand DNA-binding protein